jgi:metal-responsive CopG/Arc/MetJ family transcriptional regulator
VLFYNTEKHNEDLEGNKSMIEEKRHITLRIPSDMVEKIEELAAAHHRDRSGEILHALSLYIAAHEEVKSTDQYVILIQLLETIRSTLPKQ